MLGYSDSTKESGALAAAWLLHGAESQLARIAGAARGAPDALPRAWRRHRSWRWADEPRHPGQRAALAGRAHQDHRAGRGRGRPLRQPRHRAAAPRAAHQRRAHGLLQRPRADGAVGAHGRQRHHRGARRAVGAGLPRPGLGGSRLRGLLRGRHTHRRALRADPWLATGRARERRRLAAQAAGHPLGVLVGAGARLPAGLVRPGHGRGGLRGATTARVPPGSSRRSIARRPSSPASSTSWRWPWPRSTWPWPASTPAWLPRPTGSASGPPSAPSTSAPWPPSCASPAARTCWMRLPSLQRSIQLRNPYVDSLSEIQVMLLGRLRAMAPDDPAPPAPAAPRAADRERRRRGAAEHRVGRRAHDLPNGPLAT